MAQRNIVSFEQDEESHWVARLACGHTQHVRHNPPLESRAWVTTKSDRQEKIGVELDCLFCNMPTLPSNVEVYKSTKTFSESTIPVGLTHKHTTKAGTWGRIVIAEGRLLYEILAPETSPDAAPQIKDNWVLRAGVVGIVAPEEPHQVRALGPVSFHVEFLK
jgi:tellurite resistance-related uncharacterized protein